MRYYTDHSVRVVTPVTLYKTTIGGLAFSTDDLPAIFFPFVTNGLRTEQGAYFMQSADRADYQKIASGFYVGYSHDIVQVRKFEDFKLFIAGRYMMLLFEQGYAGDIRSRVFESDPTAEETALAIYHLYPNADYFDFVVGSLYPEQLSALKTYVQLKVLS